MPHHIKTLGTCVGLQAAKTIADTIINAGGNFCPHFGTQFVSKLSTFQDQPGEIATSLRQSMGPLFPGLPYTAKKLYSGIVKPLNGIQTINELDLIVIDLQGEVYPSILHNDEEFMVHPISQQNLHHFPKWLIELFSSYYYPLVTFDTLDVQSNRIISVINQISKKTNKIIIVDTFFSSNVCGPHLSKPQPHRYALADYCFPVELENENFKNLTFSEDRFNQMHSYIFEKVKQQCPDCIYVIPDRNFLFSDTDHQHGMHPVHLHELSLAHIKEKMSVALRLVS